MEDDEKNATEVPSPEDYEAEAAELAEKKRLKKIAAAQRKIAAAERKQKRDAAVRMLEDLAASVNFVYLGSASYFVVSFIVQIYFQIASRGVKSAGKEWTEKSFSYPLA